MHRRMTRTIATLTAAAALLLGATACDEEATKSQQEQAAKRDAVYDALLADQEVSSPTYSNDLANIDFWVDTWGTAPGKLAYVYLLSGTGEFIGYYILDGLPTTKCKNATPTWDTITGTSGGYSQTLIVPAPGLSGTYGTGSGDCTTFYGKDASTGAYVEWTVTELTMLTFDQPFPLPEGVTPPMPLGFTEIGEE